MYSTFWSEIPSSQNLSRMFAEDGMYIKNWLTQKETQKQTNKQKRKEKKKQQTKPIW